MKERVDEFSSTVSGLRNNVSSLEEKFAKEESDKLVGLSIVHAYWFFVCR